MTTLTDLVTRWEAAYQRYTDAARAVRSAPDAEPASAETMAEASWEVATAWRDIATTMVLPWWTLAALRAAADAFEAQAMSWHRDGTTRGVGND